MQLVRPIYVPGVDHPIALREHEGMPLLAAECPMPAELVLEVDLTLIPERSKEDQVTRLFE